MEAKNPEALRRTIKRAKKAISSRDEYVQLWDNVREFTTPERLLFVQRSHDDVYRNIYSSTAPRALRGLTNVVINGLMPPWTPWAMLSPAPHVQGPIREELRKALDIPNKLLLLYMNLSNLHQESHLTISELVNIGTGAIRVEPNRENKGLRFKNCSVNRLAVDEDSTGRITSTYYTYKMPGWELRDRYPHISEYADLAERIERDEDAEFELWAMVVPEESGDGFDYWLTVDEKRDNLEPIVLAERRLATNPIKVTRWERQPDSPYGVGVGTIMQHDVFTHNKFMEYAHKAALIDTLGIWTVKQDGYINELTLEMMVGTLTPVSSNDKTNPTLARTGTSSDLNAARAIIGELAASIKEGYYEDRFGDIGKTPMTATEVVQRSRMLLQKLGAPYILIENELLMPVISDAVDILIEQRVLPKVARVRPFGAVSVTFLSSLAQSQRVQDVDSLFQWATMAAQLAQVDPTAMSVMDVHKAVRYIAEQMGVPPSVLRTQQEAEAYQQRMMEAIQAGQAAGGREAAREEMQKQAEAQGMAA